MNQKFDLDTLLVAVTELEKLAVARERRAQQLQEMLLRIECFQPSEPQPGGRA